MFEKQPFRSFRRQIISKTGGKHIPDIERGCVEQDINFRPFILLFCNVVGFYIKIIVQSLEIAVQIRASAFQVLKVFTNFSRR